jgi:hypothetical protein
LKGAKHVTFVITPIPNSQVHGFQNNPRELLSFLFPMCALILGINIDVCLSPQGSK